MVLGTRHNPSPTTLFNVYEELWMRNTHQILHYNQILPNAVAK